MAGRKVTIVGEEVMLIVQIIGTIGITDGRPWQYKVTVWTDSNNKYETKEVPCEGDPEFNERILIPQNEDPPAEYLHVKVTKRNVDSDVLGPCLVGTARTLLPPTKGQDFDIDVMLSGPEETGFVQLSLHLMNIEVLGYAP